MKLGIETKGLKKLERKLKDLERNAKALDGSNHVLLSELFTEQFLLKRTNFHSLEDMVSKAKSNNFDLESQETFDNLSTDDKWDSFIQTQTTFSSWQEMLNKAAAEWTKRKLGLR